jgi:hypothetical protein
VDEVRQEGHVRWSVYVAYMSAVGVGLTAVIIISLILMQVRVSFLSVADDFICFVSRPLTLFSTVKDFMPM